MVQSSNNPFDKQKAIPGVKKIIAVCSGKGGVGKSTVATNLALALSKTHKVGLLDADIYGPSIPRMMGALGQKPSIDENNKITPLVRFGLKLMSIGFLIDENTAVVWRGPMLFKAMDQFIHDVNWGELDYLVIDLPPGTGDIQLTMAQKIPVAGAVVVTTPQNIALADVKKSIDMFERIGVKIFGVAENMSYMIAPQSGERIQMFPKGDLNNYLEQKKIYKLAEIPFHPQISMGSEMGIPMVEAHPKSEEAQKYFDLAKAVIELS